MTTRSLAALALAGCSPADVPDPVALAAADLDAASWPRTDAPIAVREGLLGTYVRFGATLDGYPVFARHAVVRVAADGSTTRFARDPDDAWAAPVPAIDEATAVALAGGGTLVALGVDPTLPALVYAVDVGYDRVHVDAVTGEILARRDRRVFADGSGRVFDPNPVASTGVLTLQDLNDANQSALTAALRTVPLPRLDGTGVLRGSWVDAHRPSDRAASTTLEFSYDRADDRFEEVMTYYHLDRMQDRLQTLGFTDANGRRQDVVVNGTGDDNSWYDPQAHRITMGTGGVDDAEDAEVLVHEYGHAVQGDQIPDRDGWNSETSALGEGFGDYLAATYADGTGAQVTDPACIADWDAVGYPDDRDCLRRVDGDGHYPEDLVYESHADGEIWSAALWELRGTLGADVVDTLVVESQFAYPGDVSFFEAGEALLAAEQEFTGGSNADVVRRTLIGHGVSRALTVAPTPTTGMRSEAVDLGNPRSSKGDYADDLDHSTTFTAPGAVALRVHFDRFSTETHDECLAGVCDNVYLTNSDGDLFQVLGGPLGDVTSVVIAGDTVRIRLVTDRSVGDDGYHVDRIDVFADDLPPDTDTGDPTDTGDTDAPDDSDTIGPIDERVVAQRCACQSGAPSSALGPIALGLALALARRRRR